MLHRPATDADLHALHAIYTHPDVNPFVSFEPVDESEFRTLVAEWRASGDFLVAEDDGAIVAAYVVQRKRRRLSHIAYIGSVAVTPGRQRRGVGTRVMRELIDRLRGEGCSRIELLVSADNPRAIEFYRLLGFAVEGTHRGYLRRAGAAAFVDEYTMARVEPGPPAATAQPPGHADRLQV
jgi:putative acetyltransferase